MILKYHQIHSVKNRFVNTIHYFMRFLNLLKNASFIFLNKIIYVKKIIITVIITAVMKTAKIFKIIK